MPEVNTDELRQHRLFGTAPLMMAWCSTKCANLGACPQSRHSQGSGTWPGGRSCCGNATCASSWAWTMTTCRPSSSWHTSGADRSVGAAPPHLCAERLRPDRQGGCAGRILLDARLYQYPCPSEIDGGGSLLLTATGSWSGVLRTPHGALLPVDLDAALIWTQRLVTMWEVPLMQHDYRSRIDADSMETQSANCRDVMVARGSAGSPSRRSRR